MKRSQVIECSDIKRKKNEIHVDYNQPTTSIAMEFTVVINKEQIPSSKNSSFTSNPTDINALNGDCLREIFKYCEVADLFNMSLTSNKMKSAVLENGLKGRMFDFSELKDCCHILDVFKIFGQHMTKLKIGEKDIQYKERSFSKIDEILRLISTYCPIDTLEYLDLQYYYGSKIKKRFLHASLPFFSGIKSLKMRETDHYGSEICIDYFHFKSKFNPSINDFIERIVGHAVNITKIEIRNLRITGRFFFLNHVRNLEMLSLIGCHVNVPDGFISFLQDKPALKSFEWNNSSLHGLDTHTSHSSNSVYRLATNQLADLEAFYYYPNEGFINDQNKYKGVRHFNLPDFKLLANFNKLKTLSIHGLTVECLKVLTEKNTVEKLLTACTEVYGNSDDFNFLENFRSLKSIKLTINIMANATIVNRKILEKLPHLTEFHLHVIKNDDEFIVKVIESVKRLSILNIEWRNGTLTTALYSKILQIRLENGSSANPLIIEIEGKSLKECLSNLGQTYRPDVIKIRKANKASN